MTVIRITIKKNLTESAYSYRQSVSGLFSSEYLVRTDAAFPSPQIREYAINIAQAESHLYPACVRFDTANVKLATPGASPEALRGQFSHVGLDRLRGQLAMSEEDALAFPPVTAVYTRQAQWGHNGRLLFPRALTTTEWNLYTQKRVLPQRFQTPLQQPDALNPTPSLSLSQDLIEAVRAANGTYVMPGVAGDDEQHLRKITRFVFVEFKVNASSLRKKKKTRAAKGTTQRRTVLANLPMSEPDSEVFANLSTDAVPSTPAKGPVPGVVYLLQAGEHFKIGKSITFDKRLNQIKLQLPYAVGVVHVIEATNPSQVESHWHRRFAALRRNGEWFLLTDAEVAEFKSVSAM